MSRRARTWTFAILALGSATACNAILGIHDLSTPDLPDGAVAEGSVGTDAPVTNETGADAGCDVCRVEEPQTKGSIYPTWKITSDLLILNVATGGVNPRLPVYSSAGTGAVTEATSGLTWQTAYANGGADLTFAEATAACTALGAGWRVPTRVELATTQYRQELVADGGVASRETCIPPVFDKTAYRYAWTSTTVPGTDGGQLYYTDETVCAYLAATPVEKCGVRCVKGDTKTARFDVYNGRNTVHALDTNLEWERDGVLVKTFAEAKKHCDDKGMRLPIIQELYGILDTRTLTLTDPRLFAALPAQAIALVSQTVYEITPEGPYYAAIATVEGSRGHEDNIEPNATGQSLARCVREFSP